MNSPCKRQADVIFIPQFMGTHNVYLNLKKFHISLALQYANEITGLTDEEMTQNCPIVLFSHSAVLLLPSLHFPVHYFCHISKTRFFFLLFFDKRHVYNRLSLDFYQKLRANEEKAQAEFPPTIIFKKIFFEFLKILTKYQRITMKSVIQNPFFFLRLCN